MRAERGQELERSEGYDHPLRPVSENLMKVRWLVRRSHRTW